MADNESILGEIYLSLIALETQLPFHFYDIGKQARTSAKPRPSLHLVRKVRFAPLRYRKNKTRSYRCGLLVRRDDKIRTCDPLHPMQVRYRAALRPEKGFGGVQR